MPGPQRLVLNKKLAFMVESLFKKKAFALAGVAWLVGASSCTLRGDGFDSGSGHMPRLQIQSWVQARACGN